MDNRKEISNILSLCCKLINRHKILFANTFKSVKRHNMFSRLACFWKHCLLYFEGVCIVHGLYDNNEEWEQGLYEAIVMQPGIELRLFFYNYLTHGPSIDLWQLLSSFVEVYQMSTDIGCNRIKWSNHHKSIFTVLYWQLLDNFNLLQMSNFLQPNLQVNWVILEQLNNNAT